MSKPTITVPHEDYTDRHDGEGRTYHAGRTVRAAADAWTAEDPDRRGWGSTNDDEPDDGPIAFARVKQHGPIITSVSPDADMEGLYPALNLPFTIAAGPYQPFARGAYITLRRTILENPQVWRVDGYDEDGDLELTGTSGNARCVAGSVPAARFAAYKEVDAPTVTYTVTVRWTNGADDVQDAIAGVLGHPVTVTQP